MAYRGPVLIMGGYQVWVDTSKGYTLWVLLASILGPMKKPARQPFLGSRIALDALPFWCPATPLVHTTGMGDGVVLDERQNRGPDGVWQGGVLDDAFPEGQRSRRSGVHWSWPGSAELWLRLGREY